MMDLQELTQFVAQRAPELGRRTLEHLVLTGLSTGIAVLIGVPLGIWILRSTALRGPVLGIASTMQTIPSLALLAFLLPLLGIGTRPAVVALVLYALLPIVRNTFTGLSEVPAEVREAARGIGFTPRQQLWMVEIPLAVPTIVAGIRTAAVICVGIATLAAAIGAGGLGQFIFRGLALNNTQLVLLGAVPAAVLALLIDGLIGTAQDALSPRRPVGPPTRRVGRWLALAGAAALLLAALFLPAAQRTTIAGGAAITVGSKNFTEQYLLGHLMAQLIEARTDLPVERRLGLGGTKICHEALVSGGIDLYAEYTGTALTAILERDVIADPETTYAVVDALYEARFELDWLPPLGFNNTYALTVRQADARKQGWTKISDLETAASRLRAGFPSEFAERPDGYPGLRKTYGFRFGRVADLDPGLMYQAVASGKVDVIAAFATDGRIAAYDLQPLEDDRGFFPPYYAAPVIRRSVLEAHPELREALLPLAGALDDAAMQRLNYEVDEKKRAPAAVAREFLLQRGLLAE
jgi:osmoprotectant transport system permease protein